MSYRPLIKKTRIKDDDLFYDSAKENLLSLLYGSKPDDESIASEKIVIDTKKEKDDECFWFYYHAAITERIKKIPFFMFWLNLKNPGQYENIINKMINDPDLKNIRRKLEKTHYSIAEQPQRIFRRYKKRNIHEKIPHNVVKDLFPFLPFAELQSFIQKEGVTTKRDIKNCRTIFRKMRPMILDYMLDKLAEEGRIEIQETSTRTYYHSL